jgi:CubicO group peptidase (beta-lactamase class C family)
VPGRDHLYSNVGFGLLGQLLCLRTGQSYEQLVAGRITSVLGMRETFVTLSHSARARLAQPTSNGFAAVNWDLGVLAGAGALRSSAHDLALFLAIRAAGGRAGAGSRAPRHRQRSR